MQKRLDLALRGWIWRTVYLAEGISCIFAKSIIAFIYGLYNSKKANNKLNTLVKIEQFGSQFSIPELNEAYYNIILIDGHSSFSINFNEYQSSGKILLFLSPYQLLKWHHSNTPGLKLLKFHGDFYCIEYHKEEVACNGILFNNIYENPFVQVSDHVFEEINTIFTKLADFDISAKSYDHSIVKSYLQLILALSSKEKQIQITDKAISLRKEQVSDFQTILDNHFVRSRSVTFYAEYYGLSVDAFSKKIKNHFGKPPSILIQERLVLEAKKLLHLTHKNIKEIATDLFFEDEFYFSRYFKKQVGVSPKAFREKVGISIVAK